MIVKDGGNREIGQKFWVQIAHLTEMHFET